MKNLIILENLIIIVPTKELYRKVVKKAIKEGYRWMNGDKNIRSEYWNGEETVIHIDKDKRLTCGRFSQVKINHPHYTAITAQAYLGENISRL